MNPMSAAAKTLDTQELEQRVKGMYEEVPATPTVTSTSRPVVLWPNAWDTPRKTSTASRRRRSTPSPESATSSTWPPSAPGETVLDLGSGSGMDSFIAARAAGPDGHTIGVDMTDEQLAKATRLAREAGMTTPSSGRATRRFHHDETRHIGYGVWFLRETVRHRPEMAPAVRQTLRDLLPAVAESLKPPGDENGSGELLGVTQQEISEFALGGLTRRLKLIGVPLETVFN
jgi:SAM-dependent methyltransferase